jgi:D-alanyl-D-alanine carboxypeptidase/D-alanyl-D-alanine-endopeptidase (penicillin-binding protein 4)
MRTKNFLAFGLLASLLSAGVAAAVACAPQKAAAAPRAAADLAAAVRAAVNASGLPASSVAISVRDVATSAIVADFEGGDPMVPASNMKVLTTAAALHVLGPDWKFRTRMVRDGDRLAVVGDGDPSLGDPEFLARLQHVSADGTRRAGLSTEQLVDTWVNAARRAGIDRVSEVVVDDRVFDRQFVHPSWPADQLSNSYCAEVAGLNFHENLIGAALTLSGGRPAVASTQPAAPWISFDPGRATADGGKRATQTIGIVRTAEPWRFTLSGNMKAAPAEPVSICVQNMPEFFARYVGERLRRAGIACASVRVAAPGDPEFSGDSVGPDIVMPIGEVVKRCNTESHNLYAEALLKRLAAERMGKPGSWAGGAQALAAVVDERLGAGIAAKALVVSDGSGLSRDNRVAPGLLTAWLRSVARDERIAAPFIESLAVAGETGTVRKRFDTLDTTRVFVPCKTGYINGTSCLTGYVGAPGATPRWAFSVMCNDLTKTKEGVAKAKALQERVVMILAGAM